MKYILQIKASPAGEWVDVGFYHFYDGHAASYAASVEEKKFNYDYGLTGDEEVIMRMRTFTRAYKP